MTEEERKNYDDCFKCYDKALNACLEYRKQIDALKEYVAYLHEAEGMMVGMMFSHNWQYPQSFLDKGVQIRAKINPENLPNEPITHPATA